MRSRRASRDPAFRDGRLIARPDLRYARAVRWLYHLLPRSSAPRSVGSSSPSSAPRSVGSASPGGAPDLGDAYTPASLAAEGFVHCSYRDAVRESARLHFPKDADLQVLRIDPRRVGARVEAADTPRGPMPHVHGPLPRDAIVETLSLDALDSAPDRVTGTRFTFVAFEGMTLLDLVGALDPVSRIASMGFDPTARVTLVSGTAPMVWGGHGAALVAHRVRPSLDDTDVLVIPGGHGTRTLVDDRELTDWLATYPSNRLVATVCTGSLLLGAAGRLRGVRATTHPSAMADLPKYGAIPVEARLVEQAPIVTAGGVSCALDLGLFLVRLLEDDAIAAKIAAQMCLPPEFAASRPEVGVPRETSGS